MADSIINKINANEQTQFVEKTRLASRQKDIFFQKLEEKMHYMSIIMISKYGADD